ncbi:MAG TPA: SDR family NAD(P)-dependent oxidoreductase [Chitinophagaceae bacterium]|nr:SDR family NAD(P)-dependent oxidoreductase [Chitinophagaceae bacterium]
MNQMKGKIVLITGCTNSIGKQTAIELAGAGAIVLLHANDFSKGTAVLHSLRSSLPNAYFDLFIARLEVKADMVQMARDITMAYPKLDVLINNESLYCEERTVSEEGIETSFAINHLAPFTLTHLLLPWLINAGNARVINVSSHAHFIAQFDVHNLQGEAHYNGTKMFNCAKLCNLLFTYALARQLEGQGICVNAVHPGSVELGYPGWMSDELPGQTAEDGADTIVFMASSAEVNNLSGMYFMSRLPVQSSYGSYSRKHQRQLWKLSERLANIEHYFPAQLAGQRIAQKHNGLVRVMRQAASKVSSLLAGALMGGPFYYQENH